MHVKGRTGIFVPNYAETRGLDYSNVLTGDVAADRRRVEILLQTISEVNGNVAIEDVVESAIDRSLVVTGAERAILLLFDDGDELRVQRARDNSGANLDEDLHYAHSITRDVVRDAKGVCVLDTEGPFGGFGDRQSVQDLKLRTVMCVPLRAQDRMLGLLYVDGRAKSKQFGPQDLTLFEALANQMAVAIDKARLVDHYVELQRKRQELAVARDVQQNLLPCGPPRVPGFDIHAYFEACEETSGDYYDYVPRTRGRIGLAVGDVSGHGFAAALVMSSAHAVLRALAGHEASPARLISSMNAFLAPRMKDDQFMTLFYAEIDVPKRMLSYVRAGHNEPLLYRRNDDSFHDLSEGGVPLGPFDDFDFESAGPIHLESGDLLLIYTDGLVEAQNADRELFGIERVRQALRAGRDLSAKELLHRIRTAVGEFAQAEHLKDDLTMVLVGVD